MSTVFTVHMSVCFLVISDFNRIILWSLHEGFLGILSPTCWNSSEFFLQTNSKSLKMIWSGLAFNNLIIIYNSFIVTITTCLAETRAKRIKIRMAVIILICKYNHSEQELSADLPNLPISACRELYTCICQRWGDTCENLCDYLLIRLLIFLNEYFILIC